MPGLCRAWHRWMSFYRVWTEVWNTFMHPPNVLLSACNKRHTTQNHFQLWSFTFLCHFPCRWKSLYQAQTLGAWTHPLQLFWKLKQSELLKTFHTMHLLFCWWIVIFLYHVAYNDIDNFTNLGFMPYIVLNCRFDDAHKSILSWRVFVIKHFKHPKHPKSPRENSDGMIHIIGDVKI